MSKCKLYKNTDSAFTEFLNTNNSQLNKFTKSSPSSQIRQIEACNISKKSFHIRGHNENWRWKVCGSYTSYACKFRKEGITSAIFDEHLMGIGK